MSDFTPRRELRLSGDGAPPGEHRPRPVPHASGRTGFPDLICLSHLRWDFVFQRPQHLMSRCARDHRVFFVEEPLVSDSGETRFEIEPRAVNLWVARVHVPPGLTKTQVDEHQRELLKRLLGEQRIHEYVLWYYTPMAMTFSRHLAPRAVVYDCMDELANFKGAPALELKRLEQELLLRADVVFCGGYSLWEAKRERHGNIHPFPSSIDAPHFGAARGALPDPPDQASIPRPRLGYAGVIDERIDYDIVAGLADARPGWQIVMLGPVVKVDPASLPRRPNLHWLGGKPYAELPHYLAGWDVALMPFAQNEATRFISPTKTPEYLAAGRPVVSTPVRDVVRTYASDGLVEIAHDAPSFVDAAERLLTVQPRDWLRRVDDLLARGSWDHTWGAMAAHVAEAALRRRRTAVPRNAARSARDAAAAID